MANLLPTFLTPLKHAGPSNLKFQNAQFTHSGSLGSSHVLWWSPLRDEEPEVLLFFIPGTWIGRRCKEYRLQSYAAGQATQGS